jgi:hypothetical protein
VGGETGGYPGFATFKLRHYLKPVSPRIKSGAGFSLIVLCLLRRAGWPGSIEVSERRKA